jgi:dihydroxyacetone kinase DhaKLM complex PTS-EIIA-like component DhaM
MRYHTENQCKKKLEGVNILLNIIKRELDKSKKQDTYLILSTIESAKMMIDELIYEFKDEELDKTNVIPIKGEV